MNKFPVVIQNKMPSFAGDMVFIFFKSFCSNPEIFKIIGNQAADFIDCELTPVI